MKEEKDYLQDIQEIRKVMDRSTRFLTLNGWSGIMAGIYALIGAYLAYQLFYFNTDEILYNTLAQQNLTEDIIKLFALAIAVLFAAVGTAIFFSYRHSRSQGHSMWNSAAKRMVTNLLIPLLTGGIFILILYSHSILSFIAPVSLIFYGLGLINASKYTYNEARYLGFCQVALGLISAYIPGYGLIFWALGFGVLHIIYGIYMHVRYEK